MSTRRLLFKFEGLSNSSVHCKSKQQTHQWGCSSVGRAPALQAGGHGFESHHLHQSVSTDKQSQFASQIEDRAWEKDGNWKHTW